MTTRRNFLTFLGALPIGAASVASQLPLPESESPTEPLPGSETLDEALEMLAPYGPSFWGGLSNHGPMTAEALVALGHQDAVLGWIDSYRTRLEPRATPSQRIDASKWHEALGEHSRSRDWEEWFSNELAESPWRDVVGLWVPRLAPGIAAAGLHGVIRVGHAVCSLTVKENAVRLNELARALAYWAAEFLTLPGEPSGMGKLAPSSALGKIELLPSEQRSSGGLITSEMKELLGFEPFTGVIELVDPSTGTPNFLADLLATFAGTYINTRSSSFEFLHAVTGAAAIVELLPHVKTEQRANVLAYTWQVTAGIFARYGQPGLGAELATEPSKENLEQLAQLAIKSGDEHTIKLVCACTREWLRNPDPRFLAAAERRLR